MRSIIIDIGRTIPGPIILRRFSMWGGKDGELGILDLDADLEKLQARCGHLQVITLEGEVSNEEEGKTKNQDTKDPSR